MVGLGDRRADVDEGWEMGGRGIVYEGEERGGSVYEQEKEE